MRGLTRPSAILMLSVLFGAACGTQQPSAGKDNGQGAGQGNQIVANIFKIDWQLEADAVSVRLDTDLPDFTEVMVTVSRTYFEKGNDEAYSRDYLSERGTVGQWRTARSIALAPEAWSSDLARHQAEMARAGLGFEVDRIEDEVEISAVVQANQPDPRFGGQGNPRLTGAAVETESYGRLMRRTVAFAYPLKGRASLGRSSNAGLLGAPLPEGAVLIERSAGNASAGVDPRERYQVQASAEEIIAFYETAMSAEGWTMHRPLSPTSRFFTRGALVLGVMTNPDGGTFTLMGS